MKLSVCMCTYNGAEYLFEQLESIRKQTRQPDEVVICDDGSTDDTRELIYAYQTEHGLTENWHLYCNSELKGYPGNFYYACSLCTGDIVFLSDQDDVWGLTKIEEMARVFENHPEAKAVCCKYGLIDAEGEAIRSIMAPTHGGRRDDSKAKACRITPQQIFRKNEWAGMAMAFRNDWYRGWSSGDYGTPHDILIAARAAEERGFLQLDRELAWHRRHDHNAGGEEHRIGRLLNRERKLTEIHNYLAILDEFTDRGVMQTENGRAALAEKRASMQGRLTALESGKVSRVVANAIHYRRSTRLMTLLCDILIAH